MCSQSKCDQAYTWRGNPPGREDAVAMSRYTANGTILLGDKLKQCYQGDVEGGLRHGHGAYVYANTTFRYEGAYVKGRKQGKGKLILSDGSYFEGTFECDEIVGHGVRVYSDGSKHEGQFSDGEASGQGVYTSAQGWKIHANFVGNRALGHGTWENADGDKYEGTFDGNFSGQGTLCCVNGYKYSGLWNAGKKHGHGFEEADGETYEGEFCDNKRHGVGNLRSADGRTYRDAAFLDGAIQQVADRMRLEYKKSIDKKGAEVPIPFDPGSTLPDLAVHISVETRGDTDAAAALVSEALWQVFASESGRHIVVRLHSGHPQDGHDLGEHVEGQALGTWSSSVPMQTTPTLDNAATAPEIKLPETLGFGSEVHLHTSSGTCTFSDFQIGGGEDEVPPGAYTLVFSSDGLADEMIAVAVGGKGKGK